MKIYLVGGAVRDALLGLPVQDRDWVVVGATPEMLVSQGFVPVGKDFPVFLHPKTGEEYALARTERKSAPGYRGFTVHADAGVTLEQDLARRDITINSIAAPARIHWAEGQFDTESKADFEALVDPFDGRGDLQRKILRHVTDAFGEDPVRILRVARFAARLADFSVAPETTGVMQAMVRQGEADALVPERVWQELARGLMASRPSRMFDVLRSCGALEKLLPELGPLWRAPDQSRNRYEPSATSRGDQLMRVLDLSAQLEAPLQVRFACLGHDLGCGRDETPRPNQPLQGPGGMPAQGGSSTEMLRRLCERLRVPNDCRELAGVVAREQIAIHRSSALGAAALVQLLERCDAFRKPARIDDVLLACECIARGRSGQSDAGYPQRQRLNAALAAAQSVSTAVVAAQAKSDGADGRAIGERVQAARVASVAARLAGQIDDLPE